MATGNGTIYDVVKGTTEPQDIQLLENREPFDGEDYGVEIEFSDDAELTDEQRDAVTAEWIDDAAGTVRVEGFGDLPVGQYGFRLKVTSGLQAGYFPNAAARDVVRVVRV